MNRTQAEALSRKKLKPTLKDLLQTAATLESLARGVSTRAESDSSRPLSQARVALGARVADDLRTVQLLALLGYRVQAATIGAALYESSFSLGYLGGDDDRAVRWLEHSDLAKSPWSRKTAVNEVHSFAFPGKSANDETNEAVFYRILCAFKHVNPSVFASAEAGSSPVRHLMESDPEFSSPMRARTCLLVSLRAPTVALFSMVQRGMIPQPDEDLLLRTAKKYFAAENEIITKEHRRATS